MRKKYRLTEETRTTDDGHVLYRIEALEDHRAFGVKAGERGGFVESEENLSHKGFCWVGDDAEVYGGGRVMDNATVRGNAKVRGPHAVVRDYAEVGDEAVVEGEVCDFAIIGDRARIAKAGRVAGNHSAHWDNVITTRVGVPKRIIIGAASVIIGAISGAISAASYLISDHFAITQVGALTGAAIGGTAVGKLRAIPYVAGAALGIAAVFGISALSSTTPSDAAGASYTPKVEYKRADIPSHPMLKKAQSAIAKPLNAG